MSEARPTLQQARDEFVTQWGAIGSAWGINRTMAQIHALLITSPGPLTTDQVMAELEISRGNAHMNLRELVGWGLVRSVIRKGERKEYFEAEKEVWKMFTIIVRERKRREIEPALQVLQRCRTQTQGLKGEAAETFHRQIAALADFVALADAVMSKVASGPAQVFLPLARKLMK
jgi:DNA-binding transcriptional regulator GbsR (MarR family)